MEAANPITRKVLNWFEEITKVPRCSKNEEQIGQWLLDWAEQNSFKSKKDAAGNIVIQVPGTTGYENSPTLVIQGHMDMVCEKTPESTHDFSKDPIEMVFEGEWLTANQTTLGADNGIAIAIALAMVLDETVEHPPLELLFTVDEETGLTGANKLEKDFIEGKILLNIDSEDEGVFTVGCAGGIDSDITIPLEFETAPADMSLYLLKAGGLRGGHSGVEIHEQRANAIKVLFRTLDFLAGRHAIRLADVKGGSAHNAIPRDAEALLYLEDSALDALKADLAEIEATIKQEISEIDPGLSLTIEASDAEAPKVVSAESLNKVVDFTLAMPHGVAAYSYVIEGLVETSNNFATVKIEGDNMKVVSSQRSSLVSLLDDLTRRIKAVATLSGGTAETPGRRTGILPCWPSAKRSTRGHSEKTRW